ncbi:6436_t:CDS:2 [Dentiscutata heterogama]|uniref:6436_t:CDS:1 n=1 Tax=Dentiscutata heterogama TaxID=1316150 RepID=A0ACA9MNL6_9GLOM|nr:6436_t:CDS:2 [Dentiscutata heterogama]
MEECWINEHDRKFLRSGSQQIILKALNDSSDPNDTFFKEALAYLEIFKDNNLSTSLINCFSMTQHPISSGYMLILRVARRYSLLLDVTSAFKEIHNNYMVHKYLPHGNILLDGKRWLLCELRFCGPANKGQTFRIIPYVAPEAEII